jgi:hypothetical protein
MSHFVTWALVSKSLFKKGDEAVNVELERLLKLCRSDAGR